jgi:YHS domain-containing protein
MISFRNRRATILPSTLTFALLCQAGLASAQSPEGWPFEEKELNPSAPASQTAPAAKTPVQQKLEELYKRDGRPLPDYMRTDVAPDSGNHQRPPQQQPQQPPRLQQPAPLPNDAGHPPAPLVSPWPTQERPVSESQGSIRQQLSDYYASQGKTMPGTRQSWNSAEHPRQPVAVNAGQGAQSGPTAASAPQPRLIDRLNPFSSFWHKDDTTYAPSPAAPTPYGNASSQASSSQNGPSYRVQPAPAPAKPQIVSVPARPAPKFMTVDLGPCAPISSLSPAVSASPKPFSTTPQPVRTSSQPTVASRPAPAPTASVAAKMDVSPPIALTAKTPAGPPRSSTAPRPSAPVKVASAHDDRVPFDGKAESEADKKSAPYTGVPLQDTDDGVTAPDPTKVTTANVNEPADRPSVAPTPATDVEQPKKPSPQPSVAAQPAPPSQPVQQSKAGRSYVADTPPAKPHAAADAVAPRAFNERQPATEMHHSPDETAAKMHKIGERVGQRGLKGFCPVALREQRELVDAVPVYSSTFESKRYYFSSAEAKERFDRSPQKYAPISGGIDVVVKASSDQAVEGTLDFAAWYKDRLFLFSSPESLEAFSLNPLPYAGTYLHAH